jgi:branched-subunit amino acid aminotransferase/4-amino-4-deoxychorismate lyase
MVGGCVWLNGEFVERDAARVSAFDAGFQHAVGLFETMGGRGEQIFRLDEHLERLINSARTLGLSEDLKFNPLREAVRRVAKKAGLERLRIRLTVTGGDLNLLGATGKSEHTPTILIVAQPATEYPDQMFERGVGVTVSDLRVNPLDPFEGHKTLNYWRRLRALQVASSAGAAETIVLQVTNHLAGGAVSNVFLVRDGALATPIAQGEEAGGAMAAPVLPGITRGFVIEAADALGVGCARKMLSIEDLLDADEVFLTNSSWGVLPVVQVEGKAIGSGSVGEVTRSLRGKWVEATG